MAAPPGRAGLKAIEKDRRRRYASANDLAADLQRLLDDEPVSAAPPTLRYQFGKFATRHRAALVTALAFSPDGRSLVSTSVDGTTRLWTAPGFNETDATP